MLLLTGSVHVAADMSSALRNTALTALGGAWPKVLEVALQHPSSKRKAASALEGIQVR